MNLKNRKYYFFIMLFILSNLFRGTTFFNLFYSSFIGIKVQYLILFICFIFFNRKKSFFLKLFVIITSLLFFQFWSILGFEVSNDYMVYISVFILNIFTWNSIMRNRFLSLNLLNQMNLFLVICLVLSGIEIISDTTFFHYHSPYQFVSVYNRAYLFFNNPNNLSLFLVFLFSITLYLSKKLTKLHIFSWFSIIGISYVNGSRLTLIFNVLVLLIFILTSKGKGKYNIILVAIPLVYLFISDFDISTFTSNIGGFNNFGTDVRFQIYSSVMYSIDNNILGHGLGSGDYAFSTNIHSMLFQVIYEFGYIGLIFWFIFYVLLLKKIFSKGDRFQKFLAIIFMSVPIVSMQVSRIFADTSLMFLIAFYVSACSLKESNSVLY